VLKTLTQICLAVGLLGHAHGQPHHPIRVVERRPGAEGGWIEHLRDDHPHFQQRQFLPSQQQQNPEVVAAFGSATPHSGSLLLHYAGDPPPNASHHPVPVLLVHGAKVDGTFFFRPSSQQGLAQNLRSQGFQVYALTFAHNQDDNYVQAQQVANGVTRVRALSGAAAVDLVGHSKGCIPATVYATPTFRQPWMSAYAGDVRRLLLLGGPNGGIDYFFRHPFQDLGASNWPMVWTRLTREGAELECSPFGLGLAGYWPGQTQLVRRWDQRYPLPQEDVNSRTSYYGGSTERFRADGIEKAIQEGDHFMERLLATPLASHVQVGLLAGNQANVAGFRNETDGPSDGIILVDSALQAPKDATVTFSQVLPCNHLELVLGSPAQKRVAAFLASP
jgi:triacylglycerol lipase